MAIHSVFKRIAAGVIVFFLVTACVPAKNTPPAASANPVVPSSKQVIQPVNSVTAAPAQPALQTLRSSQPLAPTDQVIVRIRAPLEKSLIPESQVEQQMLQRLPSLSKAAGANLQYKRRTTNGAYILRLPARLPVEEVQKIAAQLVGSSDVVSAEPDYIRQLVKTPDDPRFPEQWDLKTPGTGAYGINMPAAWDIHTGSSSIVVAVVDTGILSNHPDLSNRLVPGYDFIADVFTANDGDGRDADPSDPGDWVAAQDFCGFTAASSWHGSHVAGTIAAPSNNTAGIAGINWAAKILPVRVLGKCGGYDSDIIDGLRWAAGLTVQGVPANPNPARVINLSLGGSGACSAIYQETVNEITAKGVVLSVAAGNDNTNASSFMPANCNGVIAVAASDQNGSRASFSNYGATIKISAPGVGILSTISDGAQAPSAYSYKLYNGTSMAAPHIAGLVSLMLGIKPALTPAEVLTILQANVTAFPAGSNCTTSTCGAGIANAAAVLKAIPGAIIPPELRFRSFIPATLRDANLSVTPVPTPIPTPTPVPTSSPTPPPVAACRVGSTTSDALNDAPIAHVDVSNLISGSNAAQVTAAFKLRDLPPTLTFNRTNVPIGAMEYWWGAFIDVDNNPATGDPRSFYRGADYVLMLEYDATGTPPFQTNVSTQVFSLIYGWTSSFNDWWPISNGVFTIDPSSDILQVIANIPGASSTSRIFFISFDYNPTGSGIYDWSDTCVLFASGAAQAVNPEAFLR